jgi:hypothetical protein
MCRVLGVLQAMAFSSAAFRLAMDASSSASRPLTLPTTVGAPLPPPAELRLKLPLRPEHNSSNNAKVVQAAGS